MIAAESVTRIPMTNSSETRESLLERARFRDERAWAELVDLYSPLIVGWCRSLKVSPEATADCIQDVFVAVSRSLDSYQAPGTSGAFRGWLWTITRNKLRDAARRNGRHAQPVGGSTALALMNALESPLELPLEEPSDARDVEVLTRRALEQIERSFEPKTWQAFWRCVVDGLTTDAVARELGLSAVSVRQARSRVLRKLRQQLGDTP